MLEKINLCNGKCDVFTGLYALSKVNVDGKQDYDSVRIKHLYFDLDNGHSLANLKKLHDYLMLKNLMHRMYFSGGGFHCYVKVAYPNLLKNKRVAIYNAVMDFAQNLNFNIGVDEHSDIDAHTVGNIAQLVRVPLTYNPKRKRFCIPLLEQDLQLQLVEIQKLAEKQRFMGYCDAPTYGSDSLDLSVYDGADRIRHELSTEIVEGEVGIQNINIEEMPNCIKALLKKGELKHRERYLVILYCQKIGLPIRDTIGLLQCYLPSNIFNHCIYEEHQPESLYSRSDFHFPSCEKLKLEGLCSGEETCHH
jgi:hypothetical protein